MEDVGQAELLDAGRQGQILDGSHQGGRRPVDAALLRRCCLEFRDQIDPRGLRLHHVSVRGPVDLAGLTIGFPLHFDDCDFDAPVHVEGAKLRELTLTGSPRLPGLLGNGLRLRGDLDLSGSTLTGAHRTSASLGKRAAVWLCEARLGGRLLCRDTVIRPEGERAVQADRIRTGGPIRLLHGFVSEGEVRLTGAHIGGSLDIIGGRIEAPGAIALDLGDAVIGGNLFIVDSGGRRPVIRGRMDMGSAHIDGQFLFRNATLEGSDSMPADRGHAGTRVSGTAMSATRLTVGAEVALEGQCDVSGGLDLSMSDLSTVFVGPECRLRAGGRTALDLSNAELRSTVMMAGVSVVGTVRLSGARIHGQLTLTGAQLSQPERSSLIAARGITVDGDLELMRLHGTGGSLRFSNATLSSVVAVGAELDNPDGVTLSLHQATVRGSVVLARGFRSVGLVLLSRATMTGRLELDRSSFDSPGPSNRNPQGHAIEAISLHARGGMDLGWDRAGPSVDFTNADTTFLADNPARWPSKIFISGLTYDRFERSRSGAGGRTWDHVARAQWLARQADYDAGPYEQAARVFREHGYTSAAETILIAQRSQARELITGPAAGVRRALDGLFGASVAYGYRPGRVLWLLVVLLGLVIASLEVPATQATLRATTDSGIVYTTRGPLVGNSASQSVVIPGSDACGGGQVRCFSPVLYAIDTVVPLVNLDQRAAWYPDPNVPKGTLMQWWLNLATILGWLLSSIFALSLARLARSS
jgi:uncharacterized protein YjbI with pentapeptide repeats